MPFWDAKKMIANHLLGKTESTSSFISWSSSLLHALHSARQEECRGRKNIHVSVLDTLDSDTDYTSNLFPAVSLLTGYEIPSNDPKTLVRTSNHRISVRILQNS